MIENKRKQERAETMLNTIFETSEKCQKLLQSCPELEHINFDNFRLIRKLSLKTLKEINK